MLSSLKTKRNELIREYLKAKKGMSDANIDYFIREFDGLSEAHKSDVIYEMVGKEIYVENPVDIRTFINDPYFLGDVYGGCLFKIWRDLLDEIYPAAFCKKHDIVVLSCATRCFGKGTEILMYDGSIKKVEDVQVGDLVMGDDSTPRTVLNLARGREQMYRIIPNNGEPFVCNESHVLSLRCTATQPRSTYYIKNSIKDITVKEYLSKPNHFKHLMKLFKVPVDFKNSTKLPTDPYIYGVWLGDGNSNGTTLTSIDKEVINIWEDYFTSRNCKLSYRSQRNPEVKCIHAHRNGENDLFDVIKESTKTGSKRILKEFLTASREDRLKLLAGIIDTDGTLANGRYFSISTKIYDLAKDYAFLARSLGFKTSILTKKQKLNYKNNETYTSYVVSISGYIDEIPTVLPRKKKIDRKYRVNPLNTGFKIESIGEGDYYGFEVDGNHRFLLSDFTVQHNCGKTYITAAILVYEIYLLTCMINPIKTLQVANIVIACLSKDNATAVSQLCAEVYKCLTQSPYFQRAIKDKLSFSKIDKDGVRITDDIILKAGSSIGTVIGTNLYAGCVDEICAPSPRIAAENHIEVKMKLYQEMFDRRRASYDKAPKMTGMLMFTSSPTDEGDVLSEIIEDVKKKEATGDAFPLIRDNIPRWVAREEDTSEMFQLFLGSSTKDPCIVDGSIELKESELDRVIEVPIKYLGSFQSDSYKSIQDIAGRRTMPETALFNTVSIFERVFKKENHIFTTDTPKIAMGSSIRLEDFLRIPDYFSHPDKPECFRYIHLDMAYKCDRFGLSSVYSDRVKFTSEDGQEIMMRRYYIDFCLGVTTQNKETVDILKILEFVYSLKEKGYPLKLVTTDNHQGEIARQMIARRGVKTEYLSMEKSKEQYLNLKNIILTEALEGFVNPTLTRELRGLRESAKKIEKGKGYTDDMADSLAGALWSCSQDRFFKKNNEAISEIIQQTGGMYSRSNGFSMPSRYVDSNSARSGFIGMSSKLRQNNSFNRGNLGFNYRNPM